MTRIIAGEWGGRRLVTPKGSGTRPTSDRVRESLFASLASELGGFDEVRVLDLYAGSGALGLEALSRGAASVDLVESGRAAAAAIAANIAELGTQAARLHRTTAERFLATCKDIFDVVLLDPPYATDPAEILVAVARVIRPGGLVVAERSSRADFGWPSGITALRNKAYGETTLWYGQAS